jgi:RsiW-degrading membrane proteinase PrsW (M82 family)
MSGINILYAFLAGIVPSLLWLFFWLREDNYHPKTRFTIGLTFLLGMMSVVLAVYGEGVVLAFVKNQTQQYIVWAAIEEICKGLAVLLVALFSSEITEPVDLMIYFLTAALGFAAMENSFFIMNSLQTGNVAASIAIGDFRFIGATLVHTVASASIGFFLGLAYYRGAWLKSAMAVIGLLAAIAVHSTFNLSVLAAAPQNTLSVFAWIWCAVVILIILFEEIKAVHPPHAPQQPLSPDSPQSVPKKPATVI